MSAVVKDKDFKQYLREACSWETDRLKQQSRSVRLAWSITGAFGVITTLSLAAVVVMLPLKTTELKIVRVNSVTGESDILSEMPDARISYGESTNFYWVLQYLRFREGYSRLLADEFYNMVGLLSSKSEQQRYADFFTPKNPASPLNVYGEHGRVKVIIKSRSFLKENVAMVRFARVLERSPTEKPLVTHWTATITFKYSGAPMKQRDRDRNPLGFQVTEYRVDPDAVESIPANAETLEPAAPSTAVSPADPSAPVIQPGVPAAGASQQAQAPKE